MKRICSTTPFTQESADIPITDQSYMGSDARTIWHALEQLSAKGPVRKAGDEFVVEAEMEGASARELNRTFLSALRKVEKRTTLRAEWTSDDGTSERFFDYALKEDNQELTRHPPLCDYAAGFG